jgi:N-formylglutamate deformylase
MTPVDVKQGPSPLILALPHTGTFVPVNLWQNLNARGRALTDTDWHIDKLYDGLLPDVTTVRATFHRYVIDANRGPDNASLYPGQNTTGLVPLTDFEGVNIWTNNPSQEDIEGRRMAFHAPYHAALEREMQRITKAHGFALLYDCHSIRSSLPFLFEGHLPDFNIGTNGGASCAPLVANGVQEICLQTKGYTTVLNGRFKGGWTTRHYGRPHQNWHAIQMELAQRAYLAEEAPPWTYDSNKANDLRRVLKSILERLMTLAPDLRKTP